MRPRLGLAEELGGEPTEEREGDEAVLHIARIGEGEGQLIVPSQGTQLEVRLISPCFLSLYIEGRSRIFSTPGEVLSSGASLPHEPCHQRIIRPVDDGMTVGEEEELLSELRLERREVLLMCPPEAGEEAYTRIDVLPH